VMEEFHEFITSLKEDAFFLAEADVKPSKIKEYIGKGNRMSMLFNFLLNNSLFLAMAREKAAPIIERIKELPKLPDNVLWANFIRNLDELDLEQLTKEEREEVFTKFAPNPNMQAFGRGIRRRLAPMISANIKYNKMLYNLLFALPGIPVIVYGDEIGMGDNLVYKGRRALRTPMQWNTSINGGFLEAPPEDIDIKPVSEGIFSYHFTNVEGQKKDPDSLFNEMKNFIRVRKEMSSIFFKKIEIMDIKEEEILGLTYNDDMLVFINISSTPKIVEVDYDLSNYHTLIEDEPYGLNAGSNTLDLKDYGYRWFKRKK
jgi:maltose alpha-D-glucosyltransferase/alpha-amylase